MNRKDFVKTAALASLTGAVVKVNALNKLSSFMENTEKMPVLFLGHGNPMNAIEENQFVQGFRNIEKEITKPKAIVCVSAHWETKGTKVTAMQSPKTIHDFGNFPKELFEVQYPAPGNPNLAKELKNQVHSTTVDLDMDWGLDHGAWTVIKHMYPDADVPVIQLSLDYTKSPKYHYELAQELAALRNKGVLIVGSGNMIHNLGRVAWNKMKEDNYAYDWAIEANEKMQQHILDGNFQQLIKYKSLGKAVEMAVPTPEHFLPLLYALALKGKNEELKLFNDKYVAGSLSMTSLKIG